jgi:formate dehydrogenase major subunit
MDLTSFSSVEAAVQYEQANGRAVPVKITVDGKTKKAYEGEWLVDAIAREKEIPHVCYHLRLGPIKTCDTCLVDVNGELTRACAIPVSAGMNVVTESDRVHKAQLEAMDVILGNHELYCTVCDNNNGNCIVHNTTALLSVEHQNVPFTPKPYEKDSSNPFYRYDPDQCILCGRCVEACQNVQVNETLSINWESEHPRVLWDGGHEIAGSSCVSCGHCVSVCPCNALMEKSMLGHAGYFTGWPKQALNEMIEVVKKIEPDTGYRPIMRLSEIESAMREARVKKTKTVCTYCAVGCTFDVWTKDRKILKVEPLEGPVNSISTCVKGKFGWDYTNSVDRLRKPLIRECGRFREADWKETLELVGSRLRAIRATHGPDSIGFISSSKCTNEESYLMQKLARAVIGTNNVDNCSRYCQTPATQGLFRTVGYGGDSGSISDMTLATLLVIVGSNTADSHPVLAARLKRAHKLHGQKWIVADLLRHEMAERADIFLHPKPSTDMVWLSAVSRHILDQGWAKTDFLKQWVNGLEDYRKSLEPFTLEYAEQLCGIPREALKTVAREIASAERVCTLMAMGVTQHCVGSDTATAISNLMLVTGNYMRPGTGTYPLRGHNNVQGASDFGSLPTYLPGYDKVADPEVRERYERGWGCKVPTNPGLDNHDMVDAALQGKLRALYLFGEEMLYADSNSNKVAEAFSKLEFFIVQDIFFSETCRFADVVLPACPSLEKEGTFVNTERRIQRLYEVFEPIGDSRPDWVIIQDVARALGMDWNYSHPADIMHECASLAPLFAGVTYDRLAGYKSLQWPVAIDGTDEPLLYTKGFHMPDGKAYLYPLDWNEPCEVPDNTFDLHANNGRILEHFHEGNMTYRVPGINEETPEHWIEISRELAHERGIESGRWVEITSRRGKLRSKVLVTERVSGNEIYVPLHSRETPVNALTPSEVDAATHTPAYKETAVQMTLLPNRGPSPVLPKNFRHDPHPTPQRGVEVERKWKTPGYRMPGSTLVQIQPAGK